jgi:hypothetical protein
MRASNSVRLSSVIVSSNKIPAAAGTAGRVIGYQSLTVASARRHNLATNPNKPPPRSAK